MPLSSVASLRWPRVLSFFTLAAMGAGLGACRDSSTAPPSFGPALRSTSDPADGTTWSVEYSGAQTFGSGRAIVVAGDTMYAIGTDYLYRKVNGTWSPAIPLHMSGATSAILSGSYPVVLGGLSYISTSTDGQTWTERQTRPAGTSIYTYQGAWTNGTTVWATNGAFIVQGSLASIGTAPWGNYVSGMMHPASNNWYGIHGTSASNIWVVGDNGYVRHFDGSSWVQMRPTGTTLISVWTDGPTSAWVGSADGYIYHWDGSAWSSYSIGGPEVLSITGAGSKVWVSAWNGIYAWNGAGFTFQYSVAQTKNYRGLWTANGTDLYAVAEGPDFTMTVLHGVTVTNEPPVAAFSTTGALRAGATVSFDGSASADSDGTIASYTWSFGDGTADVIGAAAIVPHVFAQTGTYTVSLTVTDNAGATSTITHTVTITEPTTTWSVEFSGAQTFGSGRAIVVAGDTMYAIGTDYLYRKVNGTWSPAIPLHMSGATSAILSGSYPVALGGLSYISTSTDGQTWTERQTRPAGTSIYTYQGAWTNGTTVWATNGAFIVQGSLASIGTAPWGNYVSGMMHPASNNWYGIHGTSASNIWVVGDNGYVRHFDGSSWVQMRPTGTTLISVWTDGPTSAWVGSADGYIYHWDGSAWSSYSIGGPEVLSITGAGSKVWVSAWNGIYAWNGAGFTFQYSVAQTKNYRGLWTANGTDLYAVAEGPDFTMTVLHAVTQ